MPILEWIYPKLQIVPYMSDQKSAEKVATFLLNVVSSLSNFLSASRDFDKYSQMFQKIIDSGMIDTATNCICEYASALAQAKAAASSQ